MTVKTLPRQDLAERLRGPGIPLRCGALLMRLGTSLPELVDPIALLYADYPLGDDNDVPDFDARVEPVPRWRSPLHPSASTVVDGRAVFDSFRRSQALPMFEWVMNWCVFTRPNQYLLLHSAVVETGGLGLVLSGDPGAGKSTLAAALVSRGWRLFSDEVGMIRPGSRQLLALPRPIGLKNDSIDLIRSDWPLATIGPSTPGTRKGIVAHVRPPADSVARADQPATPRWIVFPRFEAGATPEVRRVSRAEALLRLGEQAFNYSMLGDAGFRTLCDVVDGCDCYQIRFGSLSDALACVRSFAEVEPALSAANVLS
ncbi:MAG: HprK-related kinase A [Vicinamibacterales bacterium]